MSWPVDEYPRERRITAPSGREVQILYYDILPHMASHFPQVECGFSIYNGVIVVWDEDRDTRILEWIDSLDKDIRDNLLVAQEHEGSLSLLWKDKLPSVGYREGDSIEVRGDVWTIYQSRGFWERQEHEKEKIRKLLASKPGV